MPNMGTLASPKSDSSESTRRKQTHLKYKCMFWPFTHHGSYLQLELHFSKSPRRLQILNSTTSVLICASQDNAVVFFQILYRGWPQSPAEHDGWRVSTLTSVIQKRRDETSSKTEVQRAESSECFVPSPLLHQHRKLLMWGPEAHCILFPSAAHEETRKWHRAGSSGMKMKRAQMHICHSKEMQENFLNKLNAILDKIPFQLETHFKLTTSLRSYYLRLNCIYYVCSLRHHRYSFNVPSNILDHGAITKYWAGRDLWGSWSPSSWLILLDECPKDNEGKEISPVQKFWLLDEKHTSNLLKRPHSGCEKPLQTFWQQ